MEPNEVTSTDRVEDRAIEEGILEVEDQGDDLESYRLAKDRTRRPHKTPIRYGYADLVSYALLVSEDLEDLEPRSYKDAMGCKEKKLWALAMKEEKHSTRSMLGYLLTNPRNRRSSGANGYSN